MGIAAATIYVFNPGSIFDSSVWGQIDSVGSLVLLATIYALARGWTEAAAFGAVLAMLVKFQFAFLLPIVAIVGIRRHVLGRSTDPALHGRRDVLRVVTSLAVGVGTLTVLMLPFGMSLYAPLAGGDPTGFLGILPEPDPSASLIGKFVRGCQYLHRPLDQRLQHVAQPMVRVWATRSSGATTPRPGSWSGRSR